MMNNLDKNTDDDSSVGPWWALYTRHQHERSVFDALSAKGLRAFLPLYDSIRRWKDRNKVLSMPLFPCYVFVRGTLENRRQIVTTPGVQMILSQGESAVTVAESEIDAIQRSLKGNLRIAPHPYLRNGDRVRVTRGSLSGVQGILLRSKNLCRLILSVEMLERSVAVEVDANDVEPVEVPRPQRIKPELSIAVAGR